MHTTNNNSVFVMIRRYCVGLVIFLTLIIVPLSTADAPIAAVSASMTLLALQGKRVLVTGAGRGIGRAIALICHEAGAKVAITSRSKSELLQTIQISKVPQGGDQNATSCSSSLDSVATMESHVADVTNAAQVEDMVQAIVADWGGLDVLVNNAGGAQATKGTMDTLESSDLLELLQLNVVAVHTITSAVLRLAMPENGKIVNISSKAGKVGLPNMSFYVASKFAVEGLTSTWAKELADRHILVHSLSPGMVDTKSFPKAPGKKGVRTAESIRDCFLLAATAPKQFTGHYMHADELDHARQSGHPDTSAWKAIDEITFLA